MNCCLDQEQLQRLVAEQVSAAERSVFEAHIDVCPSCQEKLAHLFDEGEELTRYVDRQRLRRSDPEPMPRFMQDFFRGLKDKQPPSTIGPTAQRAGSPQEIVFPDPPTALGPLGRIESYHIVEERGRGAFGVVFQAYDEKLCCPVALKVLKPELVASVRDRARFEGEARKAAAVRHAHVVTIHHVGQTASFALPYFVMEFIDGEALSERLERQETLAAREAAEIARQVALGLAAAHARGVIHRDVKTANILLEKASGRVKITDFGLARTLEGGTEKLTQSGAIVGTPPYMSPEQILTPQRVDHRSDIYSLGVLLYEVLTGEVPFRGVPQLVLHQVVHEEPRPPRQLNDKIPRDLETICLKAMAKEPARRYATAGELVEDLWRFLNGEPIQARPISAWERAWIWARRRPAVAALLAVGLVAVLSVVGAGVALVFNERLQETNAQLAGANAKTEVALQEAERARQQAELYQYLHHIARAQAEWQNGNLGRVRQLLDECPRNQRGWEWAYLERLCHGEILTLNAATDYGHLSPECAFSPDGTRLATTSNSQIRIWDARTGQLLQALTGHTGVVLGVAYSLDGRRLASAGSDRTVRVWEVQGGQLERTLGGDNGVLQSVAFSPDGTRLVSGSQDNTVLVWDNTTGKRLFRLSGHGDEVGNAVFSPDGTRIASVSPNVAKLWDASTGRELHTIQGHKRFAYWDIAFSPDGTQLALAGVDQPVTIWDVTSGAEVQSLGGPSGVLRLAFSPDGRWLVTGSSDRTVRVWDLTAGQVTQTLRGHSTPVSTVGFSPDGTHLVSASYEGTVKVWAATTNQEARSFQGFTDWATCVAFSPDGASLASGSYGSGTVKLWDTTTGQLRSSLLGHSASVFGVAFSPGGTLLASASEDRTIRLWDLLTGQSRATLSDPASGFSSVAFSPDGERLACGTKPWDQQDQPGEAKIWDVHSRQIVRTLGDHKRGLTAVAFSPDGTRLASASHDGTVRVFNTMTGENLFTLAGHTNRVVGLNFSPDGNRIATGHWDKTVNIWDARTGAELQTLHGHYDVVNAVVFSPDGTRLAAAGGEQSLKIWDVANGQEALTLRGHTSYVWSLAFSADGTRLASGSGDGMLRIWDARPWTSDSAIEREVLGLLEHLFNKPLCKADVLAYLTSSPTITPQARQLAFGLVERYHEERNPERYRQAAWSIVRRRYLNSIQYRFAFSQAETARRLAPGQGKYLTTLGAAQYRAGQYAQARATLEQADLQLRAIPASLMPLAWQFPQTAVTIWQAQPLHQIVPANQAFLAMAHHQLGQQELAQAALDHLRMIAAKPEWVHENEAQRFLCEAKSVVTGKLPVLKE